MLRVTSPQRAREGQSRKPGAQEEEIDCRAGALSVRPVPAAAPPGATSALDLGEARRAIARARGGRHRRRNSAPSHSYERAGRVAQRRGSRAHRARGLVARRRATESNHAPATPP
jgi:hypothetical protein